MSKDLSIYQFDVSDVQDEGSDVQVRDEFNRKPIAERIIKLLISDVDISPMIIDGDWGTGKSEFCHKLINKFRAEHDNVQILYIDAFQADHADNPLMTIIAEIMALIPDEPKRTGFLKKALPVIRYGTKAILKAGVSHVMKESADNIAEGLGKEIQEAANTAIDVTVTALLKDHEKAKENLKALQSLLEELAKDKPIIIFIDELDRCRPDFSVYMLEVIKHTFNVENVKFVLVTNTVQLRAAINHAYGATIDAGRYLDKFIKFTVKLPEKVLNQGYGKYKLASTEYFDQLVQKSTILRATQLNLNDRDYSTINLAHSLIEVNNLSLREVETFIRHLEIANILGIKMDEKTSEGHALLYIIAVFIDCFKTNLSNDISRDKSDAADILNLVGLNLSGENVFGSNGIIVLLASHADKNSDKIIQFIKDFNEKHSTVLERWYWDFLGIREQSYFNPVKKALDTLHFR